MDTLSPDPLAEVIPSVEAIHLRLHIVSRERVYLRRLLEVARRGLDEIQHRREVGQQGGVPCSR